jgi:hypothetical protein
MKNITRALLAVGLIGFAACGDDSLNEEDSQQGFAAANAVLSQGGASAQSSAANGAVAIDFSFNCLEGGTANFVGSLDDTQTGTTTDATFTYVVTFNNCVSQGVTLGGDVTYKLDISASDTSSTLEYSYVGDLSFSGDINGDCSLDMYSRITTSTGASGGGSANFEYRGNMCGNDAGSMNGNFTFTIPES